jgi:uncharacterized protein (DUF58 family)
LVTLLSGSLYFGSKQKTLYEVIRFIAKIASKNSYGLTPVALYKNSALRYPPSKKDRFLNRFINDIKNLNYLYTDVDPSTVKEKLNSIATKRSLFIVVGDFLDEIDLYQLSFRHKILSVIIRDSFEENPHPLGEHEFADPKTGERKSLYFGKKEAKEYKERLLEHDETMQKNFTKLGIFYEKIVR